MVKTEEMRRMEEDMNSSAELREKLDAAVKRIVGEGQIGSDGELFEKAAAELGYKITAAELERFAAEQEEIDPEELEQAAGGKMNEDGDGHDAWCVFGYHCYTALVHTTPNEKNEVTTCWKDYRCGFVYKDNLISPFLEK